MSSEVRHIACVHCRSLNRVPVQRLGEDPVCGACRQPLLKGQPLELREADFERYVARTELPVIVDFWAPWCGPCRVMGPAFEEAAQRLKGRAIFVKVNSDENPRVAAQFGIRSIPTLVRLDRGREKTRQTGALAVGQIVAFAS
jgi:thioredoxin 2